MPDKPLPDELCVIWKEQCKEDTPVIIGQVMNRRTQQLHMSTRSEIVMSIAAALFFVAVSMWRLPAAGFPLRPFGLVAVVVWIAITVLRFWRIICRSGPPLNAPLPGLTYYRRELEVRRDHLRNAWLWHGPLLLAALLFFLSFADWPFPGIDRFGNVAPLFVILVLWVAFGIWRRFRQAASIQQEIDEIAHLEASQ